MTTGDMTVTLSSLHLSQLRERGVHLSRDSHGRFEITDSKGRPVSGVGLTRIKEAELQGSPLAFRALMAVRLSHSGQPVRLEDP